MGSRKRRRFALMIGVVIPISLAPSLVSSAEASFDPGIGNVPQGTQSDRA